MFKTWGELKKYAEEVGMTDDAVFLLDKDGENLPNATISVFQPIVTENAGTKNDITGFFIIQERE